MIGIEETFYAFLIFSSDVTEEMQKKDLCGKFPGQAYVALTLAVQNARGEKVRLVGIGKNKSSAKLAVAKYYNKIWKQSYA